MAKEKSVVNTETTEKKQENTPKPTKKRFIAGKIVLFSCFTLAVFGGGAYYLQQNPLEIQFAEEEHPQTPVVVSQPVTEPQVAVLEKEEVSEIKYVIPESISNSINKLSDKVARIEILSEQYMNIKADSSAVISLAERVSELENRTRRLSLMSNNGALILTATQMIKENLYLGQSVKFEAEILKQLASSQPDLAKDIEYIHQNASQNYPSDKKLVSTFRKIRKNMIKDIENQGDWKERLWRKICKFISFGEVEEDKNIITLNNIKEYIDEKQFAIAVRELSLPENQELLKNKDLQQWKDTTTSKINFVRALSEISAYSLALMKTESLKNEAKD